MSYSDLFVMNHKYMAQIKLYLNVKNNTCSRTQHKLMTAINNDSNNFNYR